MKAIIYAGLTITALATGALAHSSAEDTTPVHDTTVDTVEVIEMRFDDPMRVTAISLTGPEGDVQVGRETGMEPVTEFRALPPADLPAGAYTVDWRGLASDGHPMQGSFSFIVAD